MKKNLLLLASVFFFLFSAKAQIKKGAHFLGGTVNFSTSKTTSPGGVELKSNSVFLSPAYGQAVKDNLIVGADLTLEVGSGEDVSVKQETNGYGAGVFIRKYLTLGKGFYLFGQGRLGVNARKVENTQRFPPYVNVENRELSATLSFYPGVSYAINKKIHLEMGFNNLGYLQYAHTSSEASNVSGKSKGNSFSIGSNLTNFSNILIGMRFILNP